MSKTLVIYYSLTGMTRKVAAEFAAAIGAEVAEIGDRTPRRGVWSSLRAVWEVAFERNPAIHYAGPDPAGFDLVLLGTPVWLGKMASPMHTFLRDYGGQIRSAGLFCTYGGRGAETATAGMARLLGQPPAFVMSFTDGEIAAGGHVKRIRDFARQRPVVEQEPAERRAS